MNNKAYFASRGLNNRFEHQREEQRARWCISSRIVTEQQVLVKTTPDRVFREIMFLERVGDKGIMSLLSLGTIGE